MTDRIHLQEEMMLRGFQAILEEKGPRQEYAAAYDAFLEEHDLTGPVGNKPENIQEAFADIVLTHRARRPGGRDD